MYSPRSDAWYYFTFGVNLLFVHVAKHRQFRVAFRSKRALNGLLYRAYTAYAAGILINVVGFAGATGRTVSLAATRIYEMSFFTGFGVSSLISLPQRSIPSTRWLQALQGSPF